MTPNNNMDEEEWINLKKIMKLEWRILGLKGYKMKKIN